MFLDKLGKATNSMEKHQQSRYFSIGTIIVI